MASATVTTGFESKGTTKVTGPSGLEVTGKIKAGTAYVDRVVTSVGAGYVSPPDQAVGVFTSYYSGMWRKEAGASLPKEAAPDFSAGMKEAVVDVVYPVGSIYISVSPTNPSTIFGGTWEAFATGRTLVGVKSDDADFGSVGNEGGSKKTTLTQAQIPTHTHSVDITVTESTTPHSHDLLMGRASGFFG